MFVSGTTTTAFASGTVEGNRDDPAQQRILDRHCIQPSVFAEDDVLEPVGEAGDLHPLPGGIAHVERDLAAVAVAHLGQQVFAIAIAFQRNLGNAREVAADDKAIRADRRAELVEPHGLVEVAVSRRTLAFLWIARVVEAAANWRPLALPPAVDSSRPG